MSDGKAGRQGGRWLIAVVIGAAGVFAWNPASARVLEKAGYMYEGRFRQSAVKDGELVDELIYAVVR